MPLLVASTSDRPPYCRYRLISSTAVGMSLRIVLSLLREEWCRMRPNVSIETGFSQKSRSLAPVGGL